ncbi:E3 ubiquitin/ISG15 ligase TRIM25 [Brienomyrus brachyistius]|uniref:E3 ubiquitin/ISG15 ligase TRIM25 n=1 Tax=Brienomyrus brachyistius TaxID=42636 RepID=UPI0020B273FF|nr:E3 ubiquitin/ISG15 ligase TRIM25 [Brienomyrus brachyistius]
MAGPIEENMLEEELTCPVCLELFQEPHLLPCGHNFCLQCVKRLKSKGSGSLKCPECRKTHKSNVTLQKNYRLANIATEYRKRGQPSSRLLKTTPVHIACDYCLDEQAPAVKTCLKCEVSMCGEHLKPHLERPAFREHLLVKPLGDLKKRRCPEHDEMFRYYCLDDKVCICNACTIEGQHTGHTIKTLNNIMKDFKASLEIQLQKANRKITKTERTLQENRNYECERQTFFEETVVQVDMMDGHLRAELDGFMSLLKECIRTSLGLSEPQKEQNLRRIVEDEARLQEVHTGIEALLKENDSFSFVQEYGSSGKKLKKLLKKPLCSLDYESVDVEGMAESMESKLKDFQIKLKERVSKLIEFVVTKHGGEEQGEEEEDSGDDDDDDDSDDDDDEDSDDDDEDSDDEEEEEDQQDAEGDEEEEEEEEDE